jgi:hypothetical protein
MIKNSDLTPGIQKLKNQRIFYFYALKNLAGIQILGPDFFTTGTLRRRYNESVPEGNFIQDLAVNGPVNDFRQNQYNLKMGKRV